MSQPNDEALTIRVLIPQAESVQGLGEFNNWSTIATPLAQIGGDNWVARLPAGADQARICFFACKRGVRFGQVFKLQELCRGRGGPEEMQ